MSADGSSKAVVAALAANLGIAASKTAAFAVTGSSSLLAEGVHSFADSANQGLLLLGAKRSRRAADVKHPFGHGAERYFYSFVVSLLLFSVGAMFALVEGFNKVRHPHPITSVAVAVVVLVIALALEAVSLRTAVRESRPLKGERTWAAFIRQAKIPELPVVLLEDLAALIGLGIALAAVVMTEATGNAMWDGVGTLAIGVLLAVVAFVLAIEMKSLLIGEGAVGSQVEAIAAAFSSSPRVVRIIHLRTLHLGPDELLVGAKLEFDRDLTMAELAKAIDGAEAIVRQAVPTVATMYVEPDLYRSGPMVSE